MRPRELIGHGLLVTYMGLLVLPQPAGAARVAVSDGQMRVSTTAAGQNVVDVTPDGLAFRVHDSVDSVTAGEGCVSLAPNEAICGGMIMVIRVDGGDGDDLLGLWDVKVPVIARGGAGSDLIETGGAADEIDAGAGQDVAEGGEGDDTLMGGGDTDRIEGGSGGDSLAGEGGEDVLMGGDGDDDAFGGDANDLVYGGKGDDELGGGPGDNAIVALRGNDTVITGTRTDTVYTRKRTLPRLRCRFTRQDRRRACSTTRARLVRRRPPTLWPPAPESSTPARARAAQGLVTVFARHPSSAKHLTVLVAVPKIRQRRVCVRIYNSAGAFLARFPRIVWTPKDSIKSPRLKAHYATGRLKKKPKCPPLLK